MFSRPSLQALCMVLVACCGVGLYHRHAQTQAIPPAPVHSETHRDAENSRPSEVSGTWKPNQPNAAFYQTIIDNNLFAPLGTQLNKKPRPGGNWKLIATFTTQDPAESSAIVENTATGEQRRVVVGDVIGDATVMTIDAKQVTLDPHGSKPVVLRLPAFVFLN